MDAWSGLGKLLVMSGLVLAGLGGVLLLAGKWASGSGEPGWLGWLGRLPGDLYIKRDHVTLFVPLTTSIVISVVLSLLLYFFSRR